LAGIGAAHPANRARTGKVLINIDFFMFYPIFPCLTLSQATVNRVLRLHEICGAKPYFSVGAAPGNV
jgi:hypothetical protein